MLSNMLHHTKMLMSWYGHQEAELLHYLPLNRIGVLLDI